VHTAWSILFSLSQGNIFLREEKEGTERGGSRPFWPEVLYARAILLQADSSARIYIYKLESEQQGACAGGYTMSNLIESRAGDHIEDISTRATQRIGKIMRSRVTAALFRGTKSANLESGRFLSRTFVPRTPPSRKIRAWDSVLSERRHQFHAAARISEIYRAAFIVDESRRDHARRVESFGESPACDSAEINSRDIAQRSVVCSTRCNAFYLGLCLSSSVFSSFHSCFLTLLLWRGATAAALDFSRSEIDANRLDGKFQGER